MKVKDFLKHGTETAKKSNYVDDKKNVLDGLTLNYLTMMNTFTSIEKHIIHALIMRPRRVTRINVANENLSKYLAIKDLSDELNMESKNISVYMSRLCDKGIVTRKLKNKKDYEYNITDKYFVEWFLFRHGKK